jgi:hypothetical protein
LIKLKFSWLELRAKQILLERMLDLSLDTWTNLPAEWSPSDIRAFEKDTVEPLKNDLQRTKAQQSALKTEVASVCERIGGKTKQLEKMTTQRQQRLERVNSLLKEKSELEKFLSADPASNSNNTKGSVVASVSELSTMLSQQQTALEKVKAEIAARTAALSELSRLKDLHYEECDRLGESLQVLEEECQQVQERASNRPQLSALIDWYRNLSQVTQFIVPYISKIEVVRSDYLQIVLQDGVELQIFLDQISGRIRTITVNNCSNPMVNTFIARAVEYNDLPYLIRALQ